MKILIDLGFQKYREISPDTRKVFFEKSGYQLCDFFWEFIEYKQVQDVIFGYSFIDNQSCKEWEGQIESWVFNDLDSLEEINSYIVQQSNRVFLPIAHDAGGNYMYLEISKPSQPVVDVSYSSGVISEVSSSFEEFINKIYPFDE